MENDVVLICQRHKKSEKAKQTVSSSYNVCLNRNCPRSYEILCSSCRPEHRDHATKILNLEDLSFLLETLVNKPFKQVAIYMSQSIEVMKKLNAIRDFKKKIDILSSQIQNQTLSLLTATQTLIGEYALSKKMTQQVYEHLIEMEQGKKVIEFKTKSIKNLAKIDYNFKSDQLELWNPQICQKMKKRQKIMQIIEQKNNELRQYSMKVIQVILNEEQQFDEELQSFQGKKKQYEVLKEDLNRVLIEEENEEKSRVQSLTNMTHTTVTLQTTTVQTQTDKDMLKEQIELSLKKMRNQVEAMKSINKKMDNQCKMKIKGMQKNLQVTKKSKQMTEIEKQKLVKKIQRKNEVLKHFQHRLRDNQKKRLHRQHERKQIFKKLLQIVEEKQINDNNEGKSFRKERISMEVTE